jgi:hypothetical protein
VPDPVQPGSVTAKAAVAPEKVDPKVLAAATTVDTDVASDPEPSSEEVVPTYTHDQILRHAPELLGHPAWLVKEAVRKSDGLLAKQFVGVDAVKDAIDELLEHEVVKPGQDDEREDDDETDSKQEDKA